MADIKRNKEQRQRDLELIRLWRMDGLTQSAIADKLNARPEVDYEITQQQVSKDCKKLEELWQEKTAKDMDMLKAREDEYLEFLYGKAMREFSSSQQRYEEVKTKQKLAQGERPNNRPDEIQQTRKDRIGDVRFLQLAKDIRSDIRALWGIDSPQRIDMDATLRNPADLTEDKVQAIEQEINENRERKYKA